MGTGRESRHAMDCARWLTENESNTSSRCSTDPRAPRIVGLTNAEADKEMPRVRYCGHAGTYHLIVRAPGFAPIERSIGVGGTNPACGCVTTVVEHVTITLGAATSVLRRDRAPVI